MSRLQLRREDVFGKWFDVDELLKDHPSTGRFRVMVLQAAGRILEGRGAILRSMNVQRRRDPGEK